jgi:3-oxoacyl-[acyl-carrier protein] reductase
VSRGPYDLSGRVAIVTGAGGGLGEGICLNLAAASVALGCLDRDREALDAVAAKVEAAGGRVAAVEADVSDRASVERATAEVVEAFGGVDVLVNNAAIYPSRPWTEIGDEEWDAVLRTNLKGYFLCAQAAFPHLREHGRGRIINVASITVFGGWPLLLPYVTSKGGVVAFTRALAREIGSEGITVNTVSPGAFPTAAEKIHPDPEGYNTLVLERQSIKRRGTPADVGNLIAFLASDAASFITGQLIQIDGGWVMY